MSGNSTVIETTGVGVEESAAPPATNGSSGATAAAEPGPVVAETVQTEKPQKPPRVRKPRSRAKAPAAVEGSATSPPSTPSEMSEPTAPSAATSATTSEAETQAPASPVSPPAAIDLEQEALLRQVGAVPSDQIVDALNAVSQAAEIGTDETLAVTDTYDRDALLRMLAPLILPSWITPEVVKRIKGIDTPSLAMMISWLALAFDCGLKKGLVEGNAQGQKIIIDELRRAEQSRGS